MTKHKIGKCLIYGLVIVAMMFGCLFGSLSISFGGKTAYALTTEVATYEELVAALDGANEDTEIVVTQKITLPDGANLDGNGATVRVQTPYIGEDGILISGYSTYGVFEIGTATTVSISNMLILGGMRSETTGAVYCKGTLNMENVTIMRSYRGLSINAGTAILKNCNIVRNVCSYGGGILCGNAGKIIMDGCSLSENYTNSSNGGGAMEINNGSKLYANNTVIINNSSGEIGGAINCYDSDVWLMNCTITGNVTTSENAFCGGGLGLNGLSDGLCYAVNTIIADNYQIDEDSKVRSDVGFFSRTKNVFINCFYGEVAYNDSYVFTGEYAFNTTNSEQNTTSTFAAKYRNDGVLIKDDEITIDFAHPAASTKTTGIPALYVPLKSGGTASTGGVKTYFDYSDLSNIKMGYGEPDAITAFGGLVAPENQAQVTTYYEGGTRANGIIGASLATDASYHTVTLAKGFSHGSVYGATVYGDTYLDGTSVTVQANADDGYMVEYWVVVSQDNATVLTENPYTFEVSEDITLVPVLTSVPTQYIITVSNGTASAAESAEGETITIIANAPAEGYEFYRWTGEGVTFADANSAITTFVMPAGEVTITATYQIAEPTIDPPDQAPNQELPVWAIVIMVLLTVAVLCLTFFALSAQKYRQKRKTTKKKK